MMIEDARKSHVQVTTAPLRFIWSVIRDRFLAAGAALVTLAVISQSIDALGTVALKYLVDALASLGSMGGNRLFLFLLALAFLGSMFGASALSGVFQRLDITVRAELISVVEKTLFFHTISHSAEFFENKLAGRLAQQIRLASQSSSNLFNLVTFYGVRLGTLLSISSIILGRYSPIYIGLILIWTGAFLTGAYYLSKACVKWSDALGKSVGELTGRYVDAISNVDAIRSFARWGFELIFTSDFIYREKANRIELRTRFLYLFIFQIMAKFVLMATIVVVALRDFAEGPSEVGAFVMTITLGGMIASVVQEISNRVYEAFDNYGSLKQALELVAIPHAIVDDPDARDLRVDVGEIIFESVSFTYPDGTFALSDVNFKIRAGEKVGIVGPSGSGKSTLATLVRRKFALRCGRILIDKQDIARCTQRSLNEAIMEVPQIPLLFNRTIWENIAYGNPDATESEVLHAAKLAHCDALVRNKTAGFASVIGDAGTNLSGGERQRISIARAFLKRSPILILDEAMAGLDPESEELIQKALSRLMEGRSVIAIAHRLSTLMKMDRIVVLVDGQIVEEGSHWQLLNSRGQYARMWALQTAGLREPDDQTATIASIPSTALVDESPPGTH
jgi:ATP-binding cassette subfamily B protein